MSDPLVSVIIRTYNRPDMLRRALTSVAAQTYQTREAVVVNDAGQDVQHVVDEFEGRLAITYLTFSQEDKPGRCLAATKGIEAANGEWIAYLDDDDIYYPRHLEVVMRRQAFCQKLCLYTDTMCGVESWDPDTGRYEIVDVYPWPQKEFSLFALFAGNWIHPSTFVQHRRLHDELGGFDPDVKVLEDMDLFIRYAEHHEFEHIRQFTVQCQLRNDDTNAQTAMRTEWVRTSRQLSRRYQRRGVREILDYFHEGRNAMLATFGTIPDLERRLAALEARLP